MKKILCLALALVMCACMLVGCGKDDTLVCGVTIFENMNELDENGNWTGFESEFAMEVGKIIGMKVEFQEIDWGQKYNELNAGAIDCIWNGFTANSTDTDANGNDVKKADLDNYPDADALKGKKACVEDGSAGAAYAKTVTDEDLIATTPAQAKAFTELKAGAVDFIVVDIILAQNLCGEGDYSDLAIVEAIELDSEIYAVGFKKGSDLTEKVNAAIKQLEENGKLAELAEKYGFENVLKVTETID